MEVIQIGIAFSLSVVGFDEERSAGNCIFVYLRHDSLV